MANTTDLLDLIPQYPTAFSDPEASPPQAPKPDEEVRTGETPQASTAPDYPAWEKDQYWLNNEEESSDDDLSLHDRIYAAIYQLERNPEALSVACTVLEALAQQASYEQHQVNAEVAQAIEAIIPDLPETYARQSSPDCVSGMCPIDH